MKVGIPSVNIGGRSAGFLPWRDLRDLQFAFDMSQMGLAFQDVARTTLADGVGETVASLVSANAGTSIRGEQSTLANRLTLVAEGDMLGMQSDGSNDLLECTGLGDVARNCSGFSLHLCAIPPNLPASVKNMIQITTAGGFARLYLTYGTTNIPYTQIRRTDAGSNWNTANLPAVTFFTPTVFSLTMDWATGERKWYVNGDLRDTADGTATIGDGNTDNTASSLVRIFEQAGTYFAAYGCRHRGTSVHGQSEVDLMYDYLGGKFL